MTPQKGKWVSRPPKTRQNQQSPTLTHVSNPEKILKVAKKAQKIAGTVLHPVSKAQSKYVMKGKVFIPSIEKVSVISESFVTNNSTTGSSTIELEDGNVCNKEKEKIIGSENSEFLSSSSKVEIVKEEEVKGIF